MVIGCGRVSFDPVVGDASAEWTVTHLPTGGLAGSGTVRVTSMSTFDTDTMTLDGTVPAGTTAFVSPQDPAGDDVTVWSVGALEVTDTGNLRVVGSRALVIVARDTIVIDGVLDGAARGQTFGPGAGIAHAGAPGIRTSVYDSAGGGGGFATLGGAGGDVPCVGVLGGVGGSADDEPTLPVLVGGSPGGPGSPGACTSMPGVGGGGGALQLSSMSSIAVGGTITVGGGGGPGGIYCGNTDSGGGSGGGTGGALFIEAPIFILGGFLAANGGGGGGGATYTQAGLDGADGTSSSAAASGGAGTGGVGGMGGTSSAPTAGETTPCGSATPGGGGGAAGRIAVRTAALQQTGSTSPAFASL